MRIHFMLPFASFDWPLVRHLKNLLPESSFTCGGVSGFGRHRHRIQLLARVPWLASYAFYNYVRRLILSPRPDFVCVGTHIEVIGCLLGRILIGHKTRIILLGFIYTPRNSSIMRHIRRRYFHFILSRVFGIICYSSFESQYLQELLGLHNTTFAPVLFGGHLSIPDTLSPMRSGDRGYIVSAGRSGRDYEVLFEAVKGLPVELHVVCDSGRAISGLDCPRNVTILRNCHGASYIRELANADFVVLALRDENISSGQMVLIDAMALGKAVIITTTATTTEYGRHLDTCYFIKPGSVEEIQDAITCLYSSPSLLQSIAASGRQRYINHHSIEPFVNSLVRAINLIADRVQ